MPGRRSTVIIQMDELTRVALQRWVHRQKTPVGFARRARALLLLEQGDTYVHTAKYVGLAEHHIRKWAKRFCDYGVSGLREKPRSGRPPVFAPEVALHVVKLALRGTRPYWQFSLTVGLPRARPSAESRWSGPEHFSRYCRAYPALP